MASAAAAPAPAASVVVGADGGEGGGGAEATSAASAAVISMLQVELGAARERAADHAEVCAPWAPQPRSRGRTTACRDGAGGVAPRAGQALVPAFDGLR